MKSSASLLIRRLQHIGIPVTEIERSVHFYAALGFSKVMESIFTLDDAEGTCIMMQHGEILIELYRLPESHLDEIRHRKNGHLDHIAFDVADIDLAFETLRHAGFPIVEPAPVQLAFWENGCRYFNITGPDQERIEFNQIL